ncbi:hypothetical protein ACJX0J_013228 [Zea mays]
MDVDADAPKKLYPSLPCTLIDMFSTTNRDQTSNLLRYFYSFDFVFYLHLMLTILGITNVILQLDELRREKWMGPRDSFNDLNLENLMILRKDDNMFSNLQIVVLVLVLPVAIITPYLLCGERRDGENR